MRRRSPGRRDNVDDEEGIPICVREEQSKFGRLRVVPDAPAAQTLSTPWKLVSFVPID